MTDWTTEKLGDHVTHKKGFAFKSSTFQLNGVAVVKVTDFTDESVDPRELVYVSEAIADEKNGYQLSHGDVVVQTVGSWPNNPASVVGKAIRVPREIEGALLNQNAVILRPKSGLDERFLFYLLRDQSFKGFIINTAQGAANQASITLDSIFRYQFRLPPPKTQDKIAIVLSMYDDLIENNMRRVELAENICRELYREWFLRMRFPGYQHAKFAKGIPEGWAVKELQDIASVNATSLGRGDRPDDIHYVDIGSVTTDRIEEVRTVEMNEAPGRARRLVQHGDTIWSSVRPGNRKYALIYDPIPNLIVSTGFAVLRPTGTMPFSFLHCATTTDAFVEHISLVAKGAAYPATSFDDFERASLLIPTDDLLRRFHCACEPLLRLKSILLVKSLKLRESRDLLLGRLVTGMFPVDDKEFTTAANAELQEDEHRPEELARA